MAENSPAATVDNIALAAFAARMMVRRDLPGLALAVVVADEDPVLVCHGYADVSKRLAVTPQTTFRLGSISKTVTAAAVLGLAESATLALTDPVEELTSIAIKRPPGSEPARLLQLLTHRAGIGEIPRWTALRHPMWAMGGVRAGTRIPSIAELLEDGVTCEAAPGAKWAYSNPAFTLLGRVVEEQSGVPYREYIKESVLSPAGMARADVVTTPDLGTTLAEGYRARRPWKARSGFEIACTPAGGLMANLSDVAAYAQALLRGARGLPSPFPAAITARMFSLQHSIDRHLKGVSLPWWVDQSGDHITYGHGGTLPGFSSGLTVCPEAGLGVVALTNRTIGPSAEFGGGYIAGEVLRWLLGDRAPLDSLGPPESLGTAAHKGLTGMFAPAAGPLTNLRFWSMFGPLVRVRSEAGRLVLRSGVARGRRLLAICPVNGAAGDRYAVIIDGVRFPIVFERDDEGTATTLHMAGVPTPFTLHRTGS